MEQFRTTPTTDRLHLTLTSAEDRQRLQQVLSDLPAGNTDILPTVLAALGVADADPVDGRVLTEALARGAPVARGPAGGLWRLAPGPRRLAPGRWRAGGRCWIMNFP